MLLVRWMEDVGTIQGKDCNGLTGNRRREERMYHPGFQRELEIEKAG